MFYILESEFPMLSDTTYYDIDDGLEFEGIKSWALGLPFAVTPPSPIVVPITRVGEGTDLSLQPIPFNDANMCLANPEIAKVLSRYPESVQFYDAVLMDTNTQEEYPWFAINIISLLSKDQVKVGDNSSSVHIGRLIKNKNLIVVSAKLKGELEHFPYLKFVSIGD